MSKIVKLDKKIGYGLWNISCHSSFENCYIVYYSIFKINFIQVIYNKMA